MIIDAHQHFWKYDAHRHSWINEEMAILKKDYLPVDLAAVYAKNGVEGSIAVQADQSEEETNFLLQLAADNDWIKGVVGWVDLRSPNLEERLNHYAKFEKLKGFRHVIQDEPDVNFILGKDFQKGLAMLGKYHFSYDILVFPTQLSATLQTVQTFPLQPFVMDHIAKPYIKTGKIELWENYMRAIGEHKNVYCKVSGMVTEADLQGWQYQDFVPYLDVVFEAFGTDRIMYGSDYPVCLLGGSYKNVKEILQQYMSSFSEQVQQKIWEGNARKFYRF